MGTENGKTTESAMPAANRCGYREGRTERPERKIEKMKRKTFVKQLMALGMSRNDANKMCRAYITERDKRRREGENGINVAWEYVLGRMYQCHAASVGENMLVVPTNETAKRLLIWALKRSKKNPVAAWRGGHPNNM